MKKYLPMILLGLMIYFSCFFNGFVWDDEMMFFNTGSVATSVYYRPISTMVYAIIYGLFGKTAFFFHFFQVGLHIGTAILIYVLFKRFFQEKLALILSLAFLVHPGLVEAVCFASSLQEVLFVLVGLIGLNLFVYSKDLSIAKVLGLTTITFMALLNKETGIVFIPLVFCYLWLLRNKEKQVIINYSVFSFILVTLYLLIRTVVGNHYIDSQGLFPIMRVPLITRLINIPSIILYYLKTAIYPFNLGIAQHWVIKSINFTNFFLPLIIEIGLFLIAIIYIVKKKDKVFLLFFLWFLIGLGPHLQIIPLNMTVAERWLYFPVIGLIGMVGKVLNRINVNNNTQKKISLVIIVLIITVLSVKSFIRVLDWRNGITLFSRDIRSDSSFDLQNNLGVELFRAGKQDQAKFYFEKSVQLAPYWWVNWNNLGASYEREKNIKKAAECYRKSITNGQYYLGYENLARVMVMYGNDKKKTNDIIEEGLKVYPNNNNLKAIWEYYQQTLK